jgi:hypothetical protein
MMKHLLLALVAVLVIAPAHAYAGAGDPREALLTAADVGPDFPPLGANETEQTFCHPYVPGNGVTGSLCPEGVSAVPMSIYSAAFGSNDTSNSGVPVALIISAVFVPVDPAPPGLLNSIMASEFGSLRSGSGPSSMKSRSVDGPLIGDASSWLVIEGTSQGKLLQLYIAGFEVGDHIGLVVAGGYAGTLEVDEVADLASVMANRLR